MTSVVLHLLDSCLGTEKALPLTLTPPTSTADSLFP